MSGGQCLETESGSDDDDDDSSTQTAATALGTSVTSPCHGHGQPTGSMSTFCHILKHIQFNLNLILTSQHK